MIGLFPRLLLVCLLCLPWPALAAESSHSEGAVAGMLVLRNGNVLSGHVIRLKDHYQVEMPNGQLQVPVAQVELFCHNLDEAYQQRRRSRTGSMADSHLELAHWCLRHSLYEHAARELIDARAIDPGHRKLAMLERRLQHARQHNVPTKEIKAVAAPQPPDEKKPDRRVPLRARATFVRQIQPMLVRSCAATGCHQSETSFQLNRLAVDGAGHPQATLGNLDSTLEHVDWQLPSESALLGYAKAAHGSGAEVLSKPLPPRQIEMLRSWLRQLSLPRQASELSEPHATASIRADSSVRTASAEVEDPFDPEVFNRRYQQNAKPESLPVQEDEQTDPAPQ